MQVLDLGYHDTVRVSLKLLVQVSDQVSDSQKPVGKGNHQQGNR